MVEAGCPHRSYKVLKLKGLIFIFPFMCPLESSYFQEFWTIGPFILDATEFF